MKKYHFDLIIANPPYGSIGANITMDVVNNIDYNEFVIIEPIKDICRRPDLVGHITQSEVLSIGAFEDATVTTAISNVSKSKINEMSCDEFLIKKQTNKDNLLYKYTVDNFLKKYDKFIQFTNCSLEELSRRYLGDYVVNTSIIVSHRESANGHLPYSKNSVQYRWNVLHNITPEEVCEIWSPRMQTKKTHAILINLSTALERNNLASFLYSQDGFRFLSMQFDAMSSDFVQYWNVFPKVDWTRSWTVQEILKEYNYTNEEIDLVMEELKKYKLGEMHQD